MRARSRGILDVMARPTAPSAPAREPGRIRQMGQAYRMAQGSDKLLPLKMVLVFLLPIGLVVLLSVFTTAGNPVAIVLYVVAGILGGVLLAMLLLSRGVVKAAYETLEGQPGAVGAVLKNFAKRGWRSNELPVNVNRNQDAVYRTVGRAGVVLIGEGPATRTKRMLDEERRNVSRILPNVPVNTFNVGPDAESRRLKEINRTLGGYKRTLNRPEVLAVSNRLDSLQRGPALPIPKGIDPMRVRAQRPR
jgi:hypothetical protein